MLFYLVRAMEHAKCTFVIYAVEQAEIGTEEMRLIFDFFLNF